jgi:hypothetical protein
LTCRMPVTPRSMPSGILPGGATVAEQTRKGDAKDWWGPLAGPLPTPKSLLAARRLRLRVWCEACYHERDADLQPVAATCR